MPYGGGFTPQMMQQLVNADRQRQMQERLDRLTQSGDWPGGRRGRLAMRSGFQNLLDIINSQGRTDPAAFNQYIQGIARQGAGMQGQTEEQLASAGLTGSGVAQGLMAAQGQGTLNRVAQAKAQEMAQAEERKRQDLMLLLNLLINPQLSRRAQDLGMEQWMQQLNAGSAGSTAQALGQLLGAGVGFAGLFV